MTRLHIELIENEASTKLISKVLEMFRDRPRTNESVYKLIDSKSKHTGKPIISVETDSNEIIDFLQNNHSGGRILTNEEYEAHTSLSKGDKGSDVLSLKRNLYEKGYYHYNPDFLSYDLRDIKITFDEDTELAVKDFQRANGLPVTGIANEETREKLTES
ncbi:peptidoglycan-binding domain-containing protein [Anabaena azotica]|uniref:peptidoglycan-binding domain-containing protein n=1 Tax=Anabaena azotica TaxID=197653 RepID=UPI0039A6A770